MAHGWWGTSSGGGSNGGAWLAGLAAAGVAFIVWEYVLAPIYDAIGPVGCGLIGGSVLLLVLWRLLGGLKLAVLVAVTLLVLEAVIFGVAVLIATLVLVLLVEGGAGVSATLDYLEADVDIPTWRHAWAYGHLTMARRAPRRVRWWWAIGKAHLKHARRALGQPLAPSAVVAMHTPVAPADAPPAVLEPAVVEPADAPAAAAVVDLAKRRRGGAA